MNKNKLKKIILDNRDFIKTGIEKILPRGNIEYSQNLKKVVVFYGVRRSGKTFVLYDKYKNSIKNSLYIDFEDERLSDFSCDDFEILTEAFYELNPQLHIPGKVTTHSGAK